MMRTVQGIDDRGIALLAALFMVLAVSLLGMTALHLAGQEIESVKALGDDAAGLHLAEAGADLVMGWMHAPSSVPSEELRRLFMKRWDSADTGLSYFDSEGRSQFRGTVDLPDIWFDASRPEHDALLNDRTRGWFRALAATGRVTSFKVYGPSRQDLLCTVEVTAVGSSQSQDQARTVRVQLAALPIPPIRAAIRAGALPVSGTAASSVLAHWGDLKIVGDAVVRTWPDVPTRTTSASLTGHSYHETVMREDRWHEMRVGGHITLLQPTPQDQMMPLNVSERQLPVPGLSLDQWDYHQLKHVAQTHGSYYVVDSGGGLHLGAIQEGGRGLTLDEVMRSSTVGDHRGLVFVDTMDQQPPRTDNLATLTSDTTYAEGVFVLNAHVTWHPRGSGASFAVLTPPTVGTTSVATRVPVQLSNVHLDGVLSVSGTLRIDGMARVFGAVVAEGALTTTGAGLEVWYNHDLRSGSYRGLPVVWVAPGTWRTL